MLAIRVGRRATFTGLMLVVAVPTALVATAWNYHTLLFVTFFLGLAGSSFAVGVGFVSRRYAPQRQGTAVGIYGDAPSKGFAKLRGTRRSISPCKSCRKFKERYGRILLQFTAERVASKPSMITTAVNPAVP
jgi:hypothetical protein